MKEKADHFNCVGLFNPNIDKTDFYHKLYKI